MYGIRKYGRKIQNALAGYSHIDNLIRQATNTDTWGPTTEQKKQLLRYILTYSGSQNESYYNDIDLSGHIDPATTHEISQYVVNFIVSRIREYSVHQHGSSIYEKLKKNLVVKGYEFLIIVKCLNLLEYLVLNCYRANRGQITYDIAEDIKMHTSVFESLKQYKAKICYDGLVMVHEKQVHSLAQRLLELLSNEDLLAEERSKLRPTEKRIASQGLISTDSTVKAHRNPFGRSRVSSVSNSVNKIISGSHHSRGSSRNVHLPENRTSRYTNDYNFNDPRLREDKFPGSTYASYAEDAALGHNGVEETPNAANSTESSFAEEIGETQEENVWADEFGSLQKAPESQNKKKELQELPSPAVDLLSSLGIDDFGEYETGKSANVHIPITNNEEKSVNGSKTTDSTLVSGGKKKDDLFGDLLVDFKTQK
ncbi:hypothetical protein BRETT_003807 [Brettanomyces bruxellensis]|uniref:ENTH domain-containing protein n=1 Tax=Dekkera bruxellensis TaxID=5007 RepID=A0A871R350_DEKBR|nr:uncharacterized protein BRETT_003807 [Brettanomyces bruxellensis]QOU19656.1 hypothetical protein BRETT_003807 [Brettanomyces bruxellensis]